MARARNIKPSFFTNEQLADNCPLGRLLFIGLWTLADYKGDLEWKERTIKIQILPWDDCDLKNIAINLDKSGLIRFYSDGEKIYVHIPNFEKHQNPHKNERDKGSDIPGYSDVLRQVIDLEGLTINPDKSRLIRNDSQSDRADSLLLIPESLNPENPNPSCAIAAAIAEEPSAQVIKIPVDKYFENNDEYKKILIQLRPELEARMAEIVLTFIIFWRDQKPLQDDWGEQWKKWVKAEK